MENNAFVDISFYKEKKILFSMQTHFRYRELQLSNGSDIKLLRFLEFIYMNYIFQKHALVNSSFCEDGIK